MPICHICREPAGEDEHCFGCDAYIHEGCEGDPGDTPMGDHHPDDHRITEEDKQ